MKYILEIKPEYEDSFKGVMILGAKEDNLFVDTLAVENLEELNSDYINEHYGQLRDEAYQRGLEDGKVNDDKGCMGCAYVGLKESDEPCVRCSKCYKNRYQPKKKDDEIKVGDEVFCKGDDESDSGVVTWVGKDKICVMWQDGSAGENQKDEFLKTGRHFDIASILKEMQS